LGDCFVKRFVLCYHTIVCLSCLSVILVYCGQTVGRIKMQLGMQVGLGPGHIVLDGDPAPHPKRGRNPPIVGPYLLWPNGWMDQGETWLAGRPRPWPHCVRWGPISPSPKGAEPPIFGPYLLWPNGWMDQDVTWQGGRPQPKRHCVRWAPSSPPPNPPSLK